MPNSNVSADWVDIPSEAKDDSTADLTAHTSDNNPQEVVPKQGVPYAHNFDASVQNITGPNVPPTKRPKSLDQLLSMLRFDIFMTCVHIIWSLWSSKPGLWEVTVLPWSIMTLTILVAMGMVYMKEKWATKTEIIDPKSEIRSLTHATTDLSFKPQVTHAPSTNYDYQDKTKATLDKIRSVEGSMEAFIALTVVNSVFTLTCWMLVSERFGTLVTFLGFLTCVGFLMVVVLSLWKSMLERHVKAMRACGGEKA